MKKTLVASVLGIAASVAVVSSSYGQGQVNFNNYNSAAGKVTFDSTFGALSGTGVDGTFTAALYFAFGASTEPADASGANVPSTLALLGGNAGLTPPYPSQFQVLGAGLGYFIGPTVIIPGYSGGPITFEVVAYQGADYASATVRGHSVAFTMPSIALTTGTPPPVAGNFDAGLVDFQVHTVGVVPEPGTLALMGLGTGALLFFRRRK